MSMDKSFSPIPKNLDFRFLKGFINIKEKGISLYGASSCKQEAILFLKETDIEEKPDGITIKTLFEAGYGGEEYKSRRIGNNDHIGKQKRSSPCI